MHLRWVGEYPLGEDEGKEEEPDLPAWCNKVGLKSNTSVTLRYERNLESNGFRWRKAALLWSALPRSPNISWILRSVFNQSGRKCVGVALALRAEQGP